MTNTDTAQIRIDQTGNLDFRSVVVDQVIENRIPGTNRVAYSLAHSIPDMDGVETTLRVNGWTVTGPWAPRGGWLVAPARRAQLGGYGPGPGDFLDDPSQG